MDSAAVANLIAGLSLLASAVAVWIGWRASRQGNEIQRRLFEIEQGRDQGRAAEQTRAELRAELRQTGRQSERLYVINDGLSAAREVSVELDGVPLTEHDAAVHNDQLRTVIGPRSEASCLLATTLDCAPPFDIAITWQDDSSRPRSYRSTLTF